ncbi:unnamed protein product [Meganyctiphanes norvegica]|uniref:WASP family protein member n=1 Tax=Meganyctiphanes norvegica TaxID=48144 RepID=A0AAV2R4H5_MEGNR
MCNNDISCRIPSQKFDQQNDIYDNASLLTLDNPQRINGLDPQNNMVQVVSKSNGDGENTFIVHRNAEEEIDSIFYGFSPTKDFRNDLRSEEALKTSFQLPATSLPPKHPRIEETAIYSPAVTQCVLDVLGGYKKTSLNPHNFQKGGPIFCEHNNNSMSISAQGPSTFLQEYLQNNIQPHRYRHHSSDSDCSSGSSHLYEEIIYGPINQKIAESPPTPPPLPPPLPARPAHIFKNSTPLKQCELNKSHCIKMSPKEKHLLHTKQNELDNLKINSKDKYPPKFHEWNLIFPMVPERCKITQGIQNSGNKNIVNHPFHLQNRGAHTVSSSQLSLNKQHQTRQKPIPPPKPPKPSRITAMTINSPVSPKCITTPNSAQSTPTSGRQIHISKDNQSSSKSSQKPSQRSNIYSIFKDRDSRRCLSASLHQESSDQLEEQIQRNTDIMEQLKSAMRISVMDCDDDYGFKVVPQI